MQWKKYILWGILLSQFVGGIVYAASGSTPIRENEKIVRISPLPGSVNLPPTSHAVISQKIAMNTFLPVTENTISALEARALKKKEINLERKSVWDTYTTHLPPDKYENKSITQYDIPILDGSGLDNLPGFQTNRPDHNGAVIRAKVKTDFKM